MTVERIESDATLLQRHYRLSELQFRAAVGEKIEISNEQLLWAGWGIRELIELRRQIRELSESTGPRYNERPGRVV